MNNLASDLISAISRNFSKDTKSPKTSPLKKTVDLKCSVDDDLVIQHKMKTKQLWSDAEEQILLKMSLTGYTRLQMQNQLGRTMQTIFSKIQKITQQEASLKKSLQDLISDEPVHVKAIKNKSSLSGFDIACEESLVLKTSKGQQLSPELKETLASSANSDNQQEQQTFKLQKLSRNLQSVLLQYIKRYRLFINELRSTEIDKSSLAIIKSVMPDFLWSPINECPNVLYQRFLEKGISVSEMQQIVDSIGKLAKRHSRDRANLSQKTSNQKLILQQQSSEDHSEVSQKKRKIKSSLKDENYITKQNQTLQEVSKYKLRNYRKKSNSCIKVQQENNEFSFSKSKFDTPSKELDNSPLSQIKSRKGLFKDFTEDQNFNKEQQKHKNLKTEDQSQNPFKKLNLSEVKEDVSIQDQILQKDKDQVNFSKKIILKSGHKKDPVMLDQSKSNIEDPNQLKLSENKNLFNVSRQKLLNDKIKRQSNQLGSQITLSPLKILMRNSQRSQNKSLFRRQVKEDAQKFVDQNSKQDKVDKKGSITDLVLLNLKQETFHEQNQNYNPEEFTPKNFVSTDDYTQNDFSEFMFRAPQSSYKSINSKQQYDPCIVFATQEMAQDLFGLGPQSKDLLTSGLKSAFNSSVNPFANASGLSQVALRKKMHESAFKDFNYTSSKFGKTRQPVERRSSWFSQLGDMWLKEDNEVNASQSFKTKKDN